MNTPRLIACSEVEPITLAQARLNLRVTDTAEDARILDLIIAARMACEQELELSLVAKTLEIAQDAFYPYVIALPCGPVRSVVSVTYQHGTTGADVVMDAADYRLNLYEGTVQPLYGESWPTARCDVNSVRVRYTAGYPGTDSPAEAVPAPIRQAMHLYIGHYFTNREAVDFDTLRELPLGARYLLSTWRQGIGV